MSDKKYILKSKCSKFEFWPSEKLVNEIQDEYFKELDSLGVFKQRNSIEYVIDFDEENHGCLKITFWVPTLWLKDEILSSVHTTFIENNQFTCPKCGAHSNTISQNGVSVSDPLGMIQRISCDECDYSAIFDDAPLNPSFKG